jgi:sporulation protein YqfC
VVKIPSKHKKNKKELNPFYTYIKETEKNSKKEYEKFLEHASEYFSIPKDVIAGQPIIRMTGNHSIHVCNYRSVSFYSTECICLLLGKKSIKIEGNKLLIENLRKEEILIVGNILNISFVS